MKKKRTFFCIFLLLLHKLRFHEEKKRIPPIIKTKNLLYYFSLPCDDAIPPKNDPKNEKLNHKLIIIITILFCKCT